MNIRRFVMTLLVGLLVSLLMSGATCYACSCIPLTFEQKIEHAEQIFTGKVVGIWHNKKLNQAKVEFGVSSVYKGDVPSVTHVLSSTISSMCGISFEFGKSYLVFKNSDGTTSICSGTGAINDDEKPLDERLGVPLQRYDNVSTLAVNDIKLRYHYEEMGSVRIDPKDMALMPLQDHLFKEMGIERLSNPDDHEQIRLAKGNKEVTVYTGSNILMLKNGPKYMDSISIKDSGIVYAPLRDLMEELDFSVVWNEQDRSITLSDNNAIVSLPFKKENFSKLEAFQKNVSMHEPDNIRIIRYSIDSGPIYIDLDYRDDSDSIWMQFDPSRDNMTVEKAYKVSCKSMIWEERTWYGKLLSLDGCSDGQKHYLLSVIPDFKPTEETLKEIIKE
ncbi:stalk domain-containing protein [Paenibacillus radicis (ex Xue et al. 2023)]|uniref:Stalk domain-containing protein n=1 Tax=Paenibacillus radicis (ex Xue et al. 2023) TaxID=2972489 RepID=A0ABT1YAI3_9BACL|nr:stalk domain-containing protein [Paenibacillus radicis (ex Xue et al. 2023)]MCR8630205.1 stalk domain-containing protein [Paenibacillus radicis (ex Xue et al. 2023)]